MTESPTLTEAPRKGLPLGKIALGVLALAVLLVAGRWLGSYVEPFQAWVDGLGVLGPVVFIAAYAVAVVAFVPGSALTLAAGAIFGLLEGAVYVFIAAVLGSSAAFLIARYVARDSVEKKVAGNERFAAIDRAVGQQGRKIAFLLRLSPAIPFNLLNYAMGLTRVRFADYLIASLGMIPGTVLYVYSGSLVSDVATAAAGADESVAAGRTALTVVGFLATLAVTVYVTVIARRALAEATGE